MENMTVDTFGCEEAISHAQDAGRGFQSLDIAWQEIQNRCRHKHLCSLYNKDRGCMCVSAEVKTGVCQSQHIMEHKVAAPNLKQA